MAVFSLTACGGNSNSNNINSNRSNIASSKVQVKTDGNILVAYFTVAENIREVSLYILK